MSQFDFEKEKTPFISPELVRFLEATYPDRLPDPDESLDSIRHRAGQVSVVRFLKTLHEDQHEQSVN
jgi:hypothetical protein